MYSTCSCHCHTLMCDCCLIHCRWPLLYVDVSIFYATVSMLLAHCRWIHLGHLQEGQTLKSIIGQYQPLHYFSSALQLARPWVSINSPRSWSAEHSIMPWAGESLTVDSVMNQCHPPRVPGLDPVTGQGQLSRTVGCLAFDCILSQCQLLSNKQRVPGIQLLFMPTLSTGAFRHSSVTD